MIIWLFYIFSFSTVSTGINGMSCVVVEDFLKPYTNWNEAKYLWISKGVMCNISKINWYYWSFCSVTIL